MVSARTREGIQILIYSFLLIFIAIFSGIGGAITSHDHSAHAAFFRVVWGGYAVAVTATFIHLFWCSALSFALWRRSYLRHVRTPWRWRSGQASDIVVLAISLAIGIASQS